jgi:hypothetical protein
LLDEYKETFNSLTPEQVDFSEPERIGQASARSLQQANIKAAERVKTVLMAAREELEQEGLVELKEETDYNLRFWTMAEDLIFPGAVSQFVNWFVKDEETEKRLRDIALKVDTKLRQIGHAYNRYKKYKREYEDLSRLPPEERRIEVGWWSGVWEEVRREIRRVIRGGD